MIPVAITHRVRERVGGDQAVLEDLARGWSLGPRPATTRTPRKQHAVRLYGQRYGYTALLGGYELPAGWCVCAQDAAECVCRDVPDGDRQRDVVLLVDAIGHRGRAWTDAALGDRYSDRFVLAGSPRDLSWWPVLAQRWTRAQERVHRRREAGSENPMRLWDRAIRFRKQVVDHYAEPIAFDTVEDEDGVLVLTVDPAVPVAAGTVYHVPGDQFGRLVVLDVVDGTLRCDVEAGDPQALVQRARALQGSRRVITRDQQATGHVVAREAQIMRATQNGAAVNPLLLSLIDSPREARRDDWLTPREDPVHVDPPLDASQVAAVHAALIARDLLIVQGPPGTGKTTFVSELIVRHLREYPGDRVLMASQTHQATDNLLLRLSELDSDVALLRVGKNPERIAPSVLPYWLHAQRPWQAGARLRAERFRRYLRAQLWAGGTPDPEQTQAALAIQEQHLHGEGTQDQATRRIADAQVIAGTCFGVATERLLRDCAFDLVILEEAGKATATEALMAIQSARKIVMIGDSRQLPPTPERTVVELLTQASDPATRDAVPRRLRPAAVALAEDLESARVRIAALGADPPAPMSAETLFAHLARRARAERPDLETVLRTQYRMVSGIGELVSQVFYDGQIEHGRASTPGEGRDRRIAAASPEHVRLVDVRGQEQYVSGSHSAANPAEVRAIVGQLLGLQRAAGADGPPIGVAVISGYARQRNAIQRAVDDAAERLGRLRIRVGLIDRFQGDEDDVVIVSTTRTTGPGFLRQAPRINVAISRARDLLIVVGHVPRMRSGRLGAPIQRIVAAIDAGDARYAVAGSDR